MNNLKDLTHGLDMSQSPANYIIFGNFDSRRFRLNLHERVANMSKEKEVIADIPYHQGVIDVSNILGNRIYEQREITYSFYRFGVNRGLACDFQTTIENLLMSGFDDCLTDSYEPDFYYTGKCKDIEVIDDYDRKRLRIQITFDLYPFKIDKHWESRDLFDPFNFDLDAFQNNLIFNRHFNHEGHTENILLYNASMRTHKPRVTLNAGDVELSVNGVTHYFIAPETEDENHRLRLKPGFNTVQARRLMSSANSVRISFDWRKERI